MLILTSQGSLSAYPYSIALLRKDNPNTSFPSNLSSEELGAWDVFPVEETEQPEIDTLSQYLEEATPIFIDGSWKQQWSVFQVSDEEVAKRTAQQARSVRGSRDAELTSTDWTQLADAPVDSSVWAVYRQQLRDIPQQSGFPWDVVWPEGYQD